jgi:hypothetical protein
MSEDDVSKDELIEELKEKVERLQEQVKAGFGDILALIQVISEEAEEDDEDDDDEEDED